MNKPSDSNQNLDLKTLKMKAGRTLIGIFQMMRIKNLRGVSEVRIKKSRLLNLGNVEKPPHSQLVPLRAREGEIS